MPKRAPRRYYKRSKDKRQDRRLAHIEKVIKAIELKLVEPTAIGLTAMAITNTWRHISAIAQGDAINQRTGNKINPVRVEIHWTFQNTDSVNTLGARGWLVRLKAGGVPIADADWYTAGAANPWGNLDYGQGISFKAKGFNQTNFVEILFDTGTVYLSPVDTTAGAEFATDLYKKTFNIKKRIAFNRQIGYEGTGVNDDNLNSLYWVTIGQTVDLDERGNIQLVFADP